MLIAFIILFFIAGIIALTLAPVILRCVGGHEEKKRDEVIGEMIESYIDSGYLEVFEQAEENHSEVKTLLERLRKKGFDV